LLLNRSICIPEARKAKPLRRRGATAMWFNSRSEPNADADPRPQGSCNRALASAITAATSSSSCDLGSGWGSRGGGGGFLSWIFSAGVARAHEHEGKPQAGDWDAHGLPVTRTPVTLSRLDGRKRYKVSELNFLDRRARTTEASAGEKEKTSTPLFDDMTTLRSGGVYTRLQLHDELQTMTSSGMFEQVSLQGKPKPDGTLALTVTYAESVWPGAVKRLKFVNVGLMPPLGDGPDDDMTAREKMDYFRRQERDYKQRVRRAKQCILPQSVRQEVLGMVKKQGKLTAGLLRRIRDHVEKWYHDEGFVFAQVQNFGNLDSDEIVLEVAEGDITKVEYQFHDKLDNIIEGNTSIAIIDRELPQQVYTVQYKLFCLHYYLHGYWLIRMSHCRWL